MKYLLEKEQMLTKAIFLSQTTSCLKPLTPFYRRIIVLFVIDSQNDTESISDPQTTKAIFTSCFFHVPVVFNRFIYE